MQLVVGHLDVWKGANMDKPFVEEGEDIGHPLGEISLKNSHQAPALTGAFYCVNGLTNPINQPSKTGTTNT